MHRDLVKCYNCGSEFTKLFPNIVKQGIHVGLCKRQDCRELNTTKGQIQKFNQAMMELDKAQHPETGEKNYYVRPD